MSNAPSPWWQGPRGEGYVVMQGLLFALVALGPRTWPGWPEWSAPWASLGQWLGFGLMLGGGFLGSLAAFHLGPNLTAVPRPKDDAALVETGAYGLVRHPIYSGLILAAVGWALWRNGWLTLLYAALLFFFFDIKARREEQWLSEKFPTYVAYQRRVRKLVPGIY